MNNITTDFKKNILLSSILLLLTILFTVMTLTVNVKPVGPNGSSVGLADFNQAVAGALPFQPIWYAITQILGYLTLLVAAGFACMGLFQLIKRRSLKKVDHVIWVLAALYVVVLALYLGFDQLALNYRPVLMDGVLEASFPSSHTMLACTVLGSTYMVSGLYFNRKEYRVATKIICIAVMFILVIGRLLSGVHWITDIIASILISTTLLAVCYTAISVLKTPIYLEKPNTEESHT